MEVVFWIRVGCAFICIMCYLPYAAVFAGMHMLGVMRACISQTSSGHLLVRCSGGTWVTRVHPFTVFSIKDEYWVSQLTSCVSYTLIILRKHVSEGLGSTTVHIGLGNTPFLSPHVKPQVLGEQLMLGSCQADSASSSIVCKLGFVSILTNAVFFAFPWMGWVVIC